MNHHRRHRVCGFTLIEISIVLIIIALVTGMAVTAGIGVIETARRTSTLEKMAAIDKALLAFRIANGRLPCPASLTDTVTTTTTGSEAANQLSCTGGSPAANFTVNNSSGTAVAAVEGAVPTQALGLPSDYMLDGWGRRMRYAVDALMTGTDSFRYMPIGAQCGPFRINNANGAAITTTATYVLTSHGANGHGSYSKNGQRLNFESVNTDEQTNCHCNSISSPTTYSALYVQKEPDFSSTDPENIFDDIISYKERWQMQGPGDRQGTVCPAVYVNTASQHVIRKYDIYGRYLIQFGSSGTGDGQLATPRGMAVDSVGNLWVVDSGNKRLQQFNSSGTFVTKIDLTPAGGTNGSGNGKSNTPRGITLDSSNNLIITDSDFFRVQKLDTSGSWIMTIGGGRFCTTCTSNSACACYTVSRPGMFLRNYAVTTDSNDNLYVGDLLSSTARVLKFNSAGEFLSQFTVTTGAGAGQITSLDQIDVDPFGNIWLTSPGQKIVKYSPSGTYLLEILSGITAGGTAVDPLGYVWTFDYSADLLIKYDPAGTQLFTRANAGLNAGQLAITP